MYRKYMLTSVAKAMHWMRPISYFMGLTEKKTSFIVLRFIMKKQTRIKTPMPVRF